MQVGNALSHLLSKVCISHTQRKEVNYLAQDMRILTAQLIPCMIDGLRDSILKEDWEVSLRILNDEVV